jgi:hypothetical protein
VTHCGRGRREIRHTLRRTFIGLLLAAGCAPAYFMAQVGTPTPR